MSQIERFSIIIPAYNAADTLERAVASALAQSAGTPRVVVSDDGSTDDTLHLARELARRHPEVTVVTAENGGCSAARNRGIEATDTEFFVLLDSDDLLEPKYLEIMSAFVDEHPGLDIYSCNGTRRFIDGTTEPFFKGPEFAEETSWTIDDLIPADLIFVMAVVRRDLWARVGGFRTDLRYAEDYDFWLRALADGASHRYTPSRLGVAAARATSKSRNRVPHAEAQIRMFADLAARPDMTDARRAAIDRKTEMLRLRIERVEMEQRLQDGDFAGARGTYLRVRPAYLSQKMYFGGLALMMVSPRLYAAAHRSRRA